MTEKGHHVHFPEGNDTFGKDNEILVQGSPNGESLSIHLGFLQVGHRYAILVELNNPQLGGDIIIGECQRGEVQSVNCKIVEISKIQTGFQIKVELFAHKEKLLKETLYVHCSGSNSVVKLILIARVLGKGKGTPLLKNGIRCIGVEMDDESESSDWQGFD